LDFAVMASSLNAVAAWVAELSMAAEWPFAPEIPEAERTGIAGCWEDLFGGWAG
jgi:hypothetical protein